jgi:hypothetical protein
MTIKLPYLLPSTRNLGTYLLERRVIKPYLGCVHVTTSRILYALTDTQNAIRKEGREVEARVKKGGGNRSLLFSYSQVPRIWADHH